MRTVVTAIYYFILLCSSWGRVIYHGEVQRDHQQEGPNVSLQPVAPQLRRGNQRIADESLHRMSTLWQYAEYDLAEFPNFVQKLHRQLWAHQFPTSKDFRMNAPASWPPLHHSQQSEPANVDKGGCEDPNRRFLVFSYGFEQGINGFAAMFQFYAGALLLAHRYGMTLVELLPADVYQASYTQADPWRRAPFGSCNGLKMGCFLAPTTSCALSLFPEDVEMTCGAEEGCFRTAADIPRLDVSCEEKRLSDSNGHSGCQRPRVVQIDVLADYRSTIFAASQDVPAWFAQEAESWARKRSSGKSTLCHAYCNDDAWRGMWFAAFEAFIFRPLSELLVLPQSVDNRIGLHVRRGDTTQLAYRYHGDLDAYLPHVNDAKAWLAEMELGTNMTVFLASDSSVTKRRFGSLSLGTQNDVPVLSSQLGSDAPSLSHTSLENATEVSVHLESWIQNQLGADRAAAPMMHRKRAMHSPVSTLADASFLLQSATSMHENERRAAEEVARVTRSVIADIWELSRSSVLIGTCFSQVGRIAYEVAFAAGRPVLPPIGLDAQACMHPSISHPYKLYTQWYDTISNAPACP